MNIPIDRLYQFIEKTAEKIYGDCVIIYRFFPHGSKNIKDLTTLYNLKWLDKMLHPILWCHDQEPLDYDFYQGHVHANIDPSVDIMGSVDTRLCPNNFQYVKNIFEKGLLLHSEKRSSNLEQYLQDKQLIPVYYWSHAIIARDWFRYAEHTEQTKQVEKTFLIYNRAWSNTREYRLKFAEFLVQLDLQDHCRTSINPIEPELGIHYDSYQFKNLFWRPRIVLENYFPPTSAQSNYSADFDLHDYESTDIEVVLETLFDDDRIQLTEKMLRPIACGQPFILAGPHGSLEYLREYGFKTFEHIWDEQYDECSDAQDRLICIANLMKSISKWTDKERQENLARAQAIADYNRKYFFSQEFFNLIVGELKDNLQQAFCELNSCNNYQDWQRCWDQLIANPQVANFLNTNQIGLTKDNLDTVSQICQSRTTC